MTNLFQHLRLNACVAALAVWACGAASATDTAAVLMQGEDISVTAQDVLSDALRVPAELRAEVLSRPGTVAQMASNLYVFRRIAQMAKAQGYDKDPNVLAALQIAQERVMADAWLAALDKKSLPSVEAALLKAEAMYKAEPQRFSMGEEVHASHILVAGKGDKVRAKAEGLLKQIQDGADFATLAKDVSDDKGSGARGGDLGFFGRGKMVEPFEEAAFALTKSGELSGLVESQFGYHIIRLEARRSAGVRPFAEVRDALVQEIQSNATQDTRAIEADKLRQEIKPNVEAIEAFAKAHSAPAKP